VTSPAAAGCFIGVDLGTSGCRAIAIDAEGVVLGERRTDLPPSLRPCDTCREQRPVDWWRAVCDTVGGLAAALDRPATAISVDGTSSTLALYDAAGKPCSPALMYDDARARAEAATIDALAPVDCAARGPTSALAKLLHLSAQSSAKDAAFALHQADWIAARLGGRLGISDENNALKLGYDPVAQRWPDWLAALPLRRDLLPRVVPAGTILGRIDAGVADRLALPHGCLVVSGTTDSNAATLAAGVTQPGDAVTSLGSTLVLKILARQAINDGAHGIYSHRLGDLWLAGGASNSGGAVLRHFFTPAQIEQLSRRIDPAQPSPLRYYPLLQPGERFPHHDPDWPPVMGPRPADDAAFLHGLLEGMARIERVGYDRLAELGAPRPGRVFSSGGGAVNATWRAIRARLLGVPVLQATHAEAAYGTALLARRAVSAG
jgi:sugar (pentulose or hexulose) kinase